MTPLHENDNAAASALLARGSTSQMRELSPTFSLHAGSIGAVVRTSPRTVTELLRMLEQTTHVADKFGPCDVTQPEQIEQFLLESVTGTVPLTPSSIALEDIADAIFNRWSRTTGMPSLVQLDREPSTV